MFPGNRVSLKNNNILDTYRLSRGNLSGRHCKRVPSQLPPKIAVLPSTIKGLLLESHVLLSPAFQLLNYYFFPVHEVYSLWPPATKKPLTLTRGRLLALSVCSQNILSNIPSITFWYSVTFPASHFDIPLLLSWTVSKSPCFLVRRSWCNLPVLCYYRWILFIQSNLWYLLFWYHKMHST